MLAMLAALAAAVVVAQEASQEQTQEQTPTPADDPPANDDRAQSENAAYETSLDFAQVENVVVTAQGDGTYRFSVTVRHADEGWDHYADVWEVYDPETGEVHGTRELLHPHDAEQPFTRSLGGVRLPGDVRVVTVRAACNVHGFGGREVVVDLDTDEGDGYEVRR